MKENNLKIWENDRQIEEIKKIFAPNLTIQEFQTFVWIGKATGLNPFLREIWAVKYGNASANIFIGRDWYRRIAQANPEYDYHTVDAVFENDDFKLVNGEVQHSYSLADRGQLVGAYCTVKRKSSTKAMFCYVDLDEYNTNQSIWKQKPATMIKKVAESQALRQAFQELFAGTYDESENRTNEPAPVVETVQTNQNVETIDELNKQAEKAKENVKQNKNQIETEVVEEKKEETKKTWNVTDKQVTMIKTVWRNIVLIQERDNTESAAEYANNLKKYKVNSATELTSKQASSFIEELLKLQETAKQLAEIAKEEEIPF